VKYSYDATRDVYEFTLVDLAEHARRVALSKAECVVEDAERDARLIKQRKEIARAATPVDN